MSRDLRPPVDILHYEIVQEQASALGRMGRALEQSLSRLREFDVAHAATEVPDAMQPARRKLVLEAGQALWMFVVQREASGLRDSRHIMRTYNVPGEVQRCMGLTPSKPKSR
ncbi:MULTISPECIES: DUF6665 family protein [Bradyrhizobium]|uniref:DUF6665 family protein n=1 Tax=Bradyrhizobium TaxID=374 RepID=UPI00155ED009|nr:MULTISPECIES: DUF6665 family protein [Bradyrhizobium]MDD1520601.1 hypothetical protein [Bradyrhizobium sp. WBAH30]MDD1545263.1 hypothetical protein [Bradyrhizobium sp. WBAH41]MDD1558873.1 hypothetical protein [Bradyrhizobium sp. WBAH23]MDD1565972.1 hypothetical protein [Bradyrhizobium sp. WBAH33]MDD1591470.1 hypothetical protein [Bradyrhizobium sp. WBAH42]